MVIPNDPPLITSDNETIPLSPLNTPSWSTPIPREPTDEESEPFEESEPSEEEAESEDSPPHSEQNEPQQPEQIPSFQSFRPISGGPRMGYTPRKSVHPPQRETLSPPMDRRVRARTFGFVPITLVAWREEEEIPSARETGESSTAPSIPSITQEPIHHTVPVLTARLIRHES